MPGIARPSCPGVNPRTGCDLLPVTTVQTTTGIGREAVTAELLSRARAELPVVTTMDEREQLLAAAIPMQLVMLTG